MNLQEVNDAIAGLKNSLNPCLTIHLCINNKGQQVARATIRDNADAIVYFTRISPARSLYEEKAKIYTRDYCIAAGRNIVVECTSWFVNKMNAFENDQVRKDAGDTIKYLENLKNELHNDALIMRAKSIKERSIALSRELGD